MTKDSCIKDVFPSPPMIAFKQARNSTLRNLLGKTKLPGSTGDQRKIVGMKKCRKANCCCGPYISEHCVVESSATRFKVELRCKVDCNSENFVYCITCKKDNYKQQYIGETGRKFKDRLKSVEQTEKCINIVAFFILCLQMGVWLFYCFVFFLSFVFF